MSCCNAHEKLFMIFGGHYNNSSQVNDFKLVICHSWPSSCQFELT